VGELRPHRPRARDIDIAAADRTGTLLSRHSLPIATNEARAQRHAAAAPVRDAFEIRYLRLETAMRSLPPSKARAVVMLGTPKG
jgi:hypothetical protein